MEWKWGVTEACEIQEFVQAREPKRTSNSQDPAGRRRGGLRAGWVSSALCAFLGSFEASARHRAARPRPRPRRSTQPRRGRQALLASPALRLLPGTANWLSQPCFHVRPRPLSLRPAPCPPQPARRPACAPQPHRGGRAPALPARGVLRALDASAPCGLGRATPACRPPGTRASQPSCGPANTGLPGTSPSREGCSSGEGAEALRARAAHPQAPPRPFPGEAAARAAAKPACARSLPQPAVPEPGAAMPKGPSSPAPPPRQSRTSGARAARALEPGSHALGSGPGGR